MLEIKKRMIYVIRKLIGFLEFLWFYLKAVELRLEVVGFRCYFYIFCLFERGVLKYVLF